MQGWVIGAGLPARDHQHLRGADAGSRREHGHGDLQRDLRQRGGRVPDPAAQCVAAGHRQGGLALRHAPQTRYVYMYCFYFMHFLCSFCTLFMTS